MANKTKKVRLNEDLQLELTRIREMVENYTYIANLMNQDYMFKLSNALIEVGYEGARMVSNGMLPDGTVEIVPKGKAEEVNDEPKETVSKK